MKSKKHTKNGSISIIILALLIAAGYGIYRLTQLGWLPDFIATVSLRNSQKYTSEEQFTYDITPNTSINSHVMVGSITIKGWDKPSVQLAVTKKARYEEDLADLHVDAQQDSTQLSISSEWDTEKHQNSSVDFVISVPKQIKGLTAKTNVGAVKVTDVDTNANLLSNVGSIAVIHPDGATGSIDASTNTGQITIKNAGGPVKAKTDVGSISITTNPRNPHKPKATTNIGSVSIK